MVRSLGVAFFVVLFSAGCAGTKEATRDVEASVPGLSHKGTGVVQEVQPNQFSVVGLNGNPNRVWFTVQPDTAVSKHGQRMELSQLEPGDAVKISYEAETGPERAYKVEVLTGGDAAKVKADLEEKGVGGAGLQGGSNE